MLRQFKVTVKTIQAQSFILKIYTSSTRVTLSAADFYFSFMLNRERYAALSGRRNYHRNFSHNRHAFYVESALSMVSLIYVLETCRSYHKVA